MGNITDDLLTSYGISISQDDKQDFITGLEEELNERVGVAVMERLDDDSVKELLHLMKTGDQEAIVAWLKQNVADYEQLVQGETDQLLKECAAA